MFIHAHHVDTHTCARTHARKQACIPTHIPTITQPHAYTGKHTHTDTAASTHTHTLTRTHACTHACMHPCWHTHTDGHARMRAHVTPIIHTNARYTDTDKNTHTHKQDGKHVRCSRAPKDVRTPNITANQCTANTKSCSMTELGGYSVVACVRKCTARGL